MRYGWSSYTEQMQWQINQFNVPIMKDLLQSLFPILPFHNKQNRWKIYGCIQKTFDSPSMTYLFVISYASNSTANSILQKICLLFVNYDIPYNCSKENDRLWTRNWLIPVSSISFPSPENGSQSRAILSTVIRIIFCFYKMIDNIDLRFTYIHTMILN